MKFRSLFLFLFIVSFFLNIDYCLAQESKYKQIAKTLIQKRDSLKETVGIDN
jgi:hypothetical protein